MTALLFILLLPFIISSPLTEARFVHPLISLHRGHHTVKLNQLQTAKVGEGTLRNGLHTSRKIASKKNNISNINHRCKVTETILYSSPLINDDDLDLRDDKSDDLSISLQEKTKVVFYRLSLIMASIACGLSRAIITFQGSAGLSLDTIKYIEQLSNVVFTWGILSTALTIPNYRDIRSGTETSDKNSAFVLLNDSLPTLAIAVTILKIIVSVGSNISSSNNDITIENHDIENLTALNIDKFVFGFFTSAISLREIGYFGAGYKVEAILVLILFVSISTFSFGFYNSIGLTDTLCKSAIALCLLVLSFEKNLEPFEDDIRPDGSSFFKENQNVP